MLPVELNLYLFFQPALPMSSSPKGELLSPEPQVGSPRQSLKLLWDGTQGFPNSRDVALLAQGLVLHQGDEWNQVKTHFMRQRNKKKLLYILEWKPSHMWTIATHLSNRGRTIIGYSGFRGLHLSLWSVKVRQCSMLRTEPDNQAPPAPAACWTEVTAHKYVYTLTHRRA